MGYLTSAVDTDIDIVADEVATLCPPISDLRLADKLFGLISPHTAALFDIDPRKRRNLITRIAIRLARDERERHYSMTDHYLYWNPEISDVVADIGRVNSLLRAVRRRHEWGTDSTLETLVRLEADREHVLSARSLLIVDITRGIAKMSEPYRSLVLNFFHGATDRSWHQQPRELRRAAMNNLLSCINGACGVDEI